jgi:hypothetical protein
VRWIRLPVDMPSQTGDVVGACIPRLQAACCSLFFVSATPMDSGTISSIPSCSNSFRMIKADWVFRARYSRPANSWRALISRSFRYRAGLPQGIPISGIGINPGRALYISSVGRGIWWRRDLS